MSDPRAERRANERFLWRTLLACLAFGVLVFLTLRVLSKPPQRTGRASTAVPLVDPRHETPADDSSAPSSQEDGLSSLARVEPDLDGSAQGVVGSVRSRVAGPLSGVSVTMILVRGTDKTSLGTTRTDAAGSFAFQSDALRAAFGADAELVVRADVAGHKPLHLRRPLRGEDAARVLRVDMLLESGATLRGRVVGPDAQPLPGAAVRLGVRRKSGSFTTFVVIESDETSDDGRFRFAFDSSATYRCTARAHGVGTATAEDLALEAGVDRDLGDLVLAGGPPIRGVVTTPGGEVVPGLELWAIDSAYASETDGLLRAVHRESEDERARGLSWTKTVTDEHGVFALAGLAPGHYALRAPDPAIVLEPHQARYEPGTGSVALFAHSQRLLVRVLDPGGKPVPGAGVRVTDLSTRLDGSYEASNTRARGVDARTGTVGFVLDPEAPVSVVAFDGARTSAEEIVMLAQNEWTHRLDIVLPDRAARGRVRLDVLGEDGVRFSNFVVSVLSPRSRIPREDLGQLESLADGLLPDLPAGTYHLVVGFPRGTDRDHFAVRTSEPVVVRANEETRLWLTARAGCRPTVTLDVRGTPPAGFGSSGGLPDLERRDRYGARITLTSSAGGPGLALQFRPASGAGLVSTILPGETLVSDTLVERGEYALSIEAAAFEAPDAPRITLVPFAPVPLVATAAWR